MPDRILMNPDNRLLASTSSNDFSLYGAQPDAAATFREAESGLGTDAPDAGAAAPSAPVQEALPEGQQDSVAEPSGDEAADVQPQALSPPAVPFTPDFTTAATAAGGSPASALSDELPTGSLIPVGNAAAASPQPALAPDTVAPVEAAAPSAQPMSVAAPAQAMSLSPPVIQPVGQATEPLAASPAGGSSLGSATQPGPATELVQTTQSSPAADLVQTTPVSQATELAQTTLPSPAADLVQTTLPSQPTELVQTPAAGPAPEVSAASTPVTAEQIFDAPTGVFATLGAVDPAADAPDDVQDLLGADPAAGIATLVSLISVTDVIPVAEAGQAASQAAADPFQDMLDSLAADPVPASNLLGDDTNDAPATGLIGAPDPPGGIDLPGGLG
ncbi:MAG: hypothetical protein M3Q08_06615 [Pseudomonadota bacterium]|nr:hypothetical protein [Pseudomonadota bacterium]